MFIVSPSAMRNYVFSHAPLNGQIHTKTANTHRTLRTVQTQHNYCCATSSGTGCGDAGASRCHSTSSSSSTSSPNKHVPHVRLAQQRDTTFSINTNSSSNRDSCCAVHAFTTTTLLPAISDYSPIINVQRAHACALANVRDCLMTRDDTPYNYDFACRDTCCIV